MAEMVREPAYAKINLALDVLRRRPDGYHTLCMVMQTVSLCDGITLKQAEDVPENAAGEKIFLSADLPGLPVNMQNLAYRAASLLLKTCGVKKGVRIFLKKRIPAEAGLAGGSADAAAVLRGLNRLFSFHLTPGELCEIGVKLGADVPFCILGGTEIAEGIGEILTPLPALPPCRVRIVKPPFGLSTAAVYGALGIENVRPEEHPDVGAVIDAIRRRDLAGMASRMGNLLERPALSMRPEIAAVKEELLREGALGALMSGSGSAVFGIFAPESAPAQPEKGALPEGSICFDAVPVSLEKQDEEESCPTL